MLFFNNKKPEEKFRNSAIMWRNYVMKIKEEKSVCFLTIEKFTPGGEIENLTSRIHHYFNDFDSCC